MVQIVADNGHWEVVVLSRSDISTIRGSTNNVTLLCNAFIAGKSRAWFNFIAHLSWRLSLREIQFQFIPVIEVPHLHRREWYTFIAMVDGFYCAASTIIRGYQYYLLKKRFHQLRKLQIESSKDYFRFCTFRNRHKNKSPNIEVVIFYYGLFFM